MITVPVSLICTSRAPQAWRSCSENIHGSTYLGVCLLDLMHNHFCVHEQMAGPDINGLRAHSYVGEVLRCCAEGHVWVRFTNGEGGLVGHMQRCIGGAWMWNVAKSACEW